MRALPIIAAALSPVLIAVALGRRIIGRDSGRDLAERLGRGPPVPEGAVWLHGASVGELQSARPLIAALAPGGVLVTSNTTTGRDRVAGLRLPGVTARMAPVDAAPVLRRFLDRHRPRALVLLEGDLWPGRLLAARARGMAVVMVSARISARSASRWARLPGLIRPLLAQVTAVYPQDEGSADRFRALGLPEGRIGPVLNLKATAEVAPAAPLPGFPRADTVLAASTHPGEEEVVLDAFAAARVTRPGLRLILAPRHPVRGDQVAALIAARGLPFTRRSAGEAPDPGRPVYLADTLGEMALWYGAAGVTFVGGSLVPKGGHTPFEPAAAGSAILHGPDTRNFADAYAALAVGQGAVEVSDATSLALALSGLADPAAQADLAARAAAALAPLRAGVDLTPVLDRLAALSPP
ncbi:MAG: 3-deoxy-D-manno-octulosonic acid transferase [Rhodobacteraceae bacterium]|nr:3-deoxy-D-manno-octulosonic acid transferase [Paracoccaceae bacterium]